MKTTLGCIALVCFAGSPLHTDYAKDRSFRVEHRLHCTTETTQVEIEVDGEPQEVPDGSRPKTSSTYAWSFTDRVLAVDEARPSKVRRHFESVEGKSTRTMNGEEREDEMPTPFDGLTVEFTRDGDDVKIDVIEGKKPEHDGALSGHRLELPLDAFLPLAAVEKGATWELDSDAVRGALGLALHAAYFPRPSAEEAPSEGGEGRGRRGRTGQMSRMSARNILAQMEWSGTAELAEKLEEIDGVECVKITLELRAQGEVADAAPEGAGGRQPRAFTPSTRGPAALESTYDAELEGALYFAVESKLPVRLELAGKLALESNRESTRGERTIRMRSKSEGEIEIRVDIAETKSEEK